MNKKYQRPRSYQRKTEPEETKALREMEPEKTKTPRVRQPRRKYTYVPHYFIMSTKADRGISGFGNCKKGKWIEVPFRIYQGYLRVVNAARPGEVVGWKVKTETEKLEV